MIRLVGIFICLMISTAQAAECDYTKVCWGGTSVVCTEQGGAWHCPGALNYSWANRSALTGSKAITLTAQKIETYSLVINDSTGTEMVTVTAEGIVSCKPSTRDKLTDVWGLYVALCGKKK